MDSVTKQCAGAPGECRKALLGILGTALRSNCACKGTDFSQLYDCMGWQRVLWFNPCVGEYRMLTEFTSMVTCEKITIISNLKDPFVMCITHFIILKHECQTFIFTTRLIIVIVYWAHC